MSEHRRPSPIQPPFVSAAHDNRGMTQVQRPPTFPTSNFLGRPEQRSLPPIHAVSQQQEGGRTLPPIQLPPLHPPSAGRPPEPPSSRSIPITQLLSQSSPAPRPAQPAPQPQPIYRSPPLQYGGPQQDPRALPNHAQPTHHRLNQPPMAAYRHPQPPPNEQYYRFSTVAEQDHPQNSPAITSSSGGRSYYGSEEPSPRTSLAPANYTHPPPRISQPPPLNYNLSIRQQPVAARACGFGERDRRVIDPPPILELKITDRENRPEQDHNAMLALHCMLLSKDGREDETEVPPAQPGHPSTRRLMGTLVASPYQAKDEHGVAGTFFVFPDLSCRSPGSYRLRFKLLRIDPMAMIPGVSSPSVASITTEVFNVFTAKDFPGMRASSALLKSLRRQGLNVGVKKGSEARKSKGNKSKKESSSSEDDSDSEGSDNERRGSGGTHGSGSASGVSPRTQPKKKSKRKRRDS
jgi:hypothetical protein